MTNQIGGWVFFFWWEIPVFVHFALKAWILQAFSQPSSNMSESPKCYLCVLPFCLSKGKKASPYQQRGGGSRWFSTSGMGRGHLPLSTLKVLGPGAECHYPSPQPVGCHYCLLDGIEMAHLILKQHQGRIWSLGFQFSPGGGGIPMLSLAH